MWSPDIMFYETTKVNYDMYLDQQIQHFGQVVSKSTIVNIILTCTFNVRLFPFDTQECKFTAGHWCSTNSQYRVAIHEEYYSDPSQLDLQYFEQSGEWQLIEPVTFSMELRTFKGLDYWNYDTIVSTFRFKRHPAFYVNVLLLPSILIAVLSFLCFLLPVESGEKVSIGITIFLSQTVQLLVMNDILPPTAKDFPILGQFVVFTIALISISVVNSVLVVKVHLTPGCKPPSEFVLKVVNSSMTKMLRIPHQKWPGKGQGKEKSSLKSSSQVAPEFSVADTKTDEIVEDVETESQEDRSLRNTMAWRVFAEVIDRLVLIVYVIVLAGGALYHMVKLWSAM